MGKIATVLDKVLNWVNKYKNVVFLAVCMAIHLTYMVVFRILDVQLLSYLNFFSSCFYFYFLFIRRDTSEAAMLSSYFEILLFSTLSELALGRDYGFFLYIIGMSATVFYLVPSYKNKRFIYQIIGIALALILEAVVMLSGISFPAMQEATAPYQPVIYLVNIAITATIVMAAAFFYAKELEKVWETLRYNMNHDVLTGLYNRRFFEQQIEQLRKQEKNPFVITMLDIDFFKKVNDTFGHEAGDEVLVQVSARLKEAAGKDNLAVRWGGEEFIIYFSNATSEQIYLQMESLRKQIEDMVVEVAGKEIRVTITCLLYSS
ncbi:MAG: GGDEF domain-containing protein, partial [Lachnospiraceae bacterium]|nr:GGDEF domain-containing protein [Lachnospiraceae bacterium]